MSIRPATADRAWVRLRYAPKEKTKKRSFQTAKLDRAGRVITTSLARTTFHVAVAHPAEVSTTAVLRTLRQGAREHFSFWRGAALETAFSLVHDPFAQPPRMRMTLEQWDHSPLDYHLQVVSGMSEGAWNSTLLLQSPEHLGVHDPGRALAQMLDDGHAEGLLTQPEREAIDRNLGVSGRRRGAVDEKSSAVRFSHNAANGAAALMIEMAAGEVRRFASRYAIFEISLGLGEAPDLPEPPLGTEAL